MHGKLRAENRDIPEHLDTELQRPSPWELTY